MKKKFYLLLVVLITLYSCQKNNIIDEYRTITVDTKYQTNKKSVSIQNITTFHDLVKFKSEEDFKNAYETLKNAQESEVNAFSMKFANYTDDEFEAMGEEELDKITLLLDSKSEELNFSEEGIYSKFEKALNFKSLRADLERKHNEWLNVSEPDWEVNPLEHQIPLPSLQTFYNVHSEIMIGSTIYKTYSNGITLIIKEATYEQLLDIRNNYNNISKYNNIKIHGNDNNLDNEVTDDLGTGKTNWNGCYMNKSDWEDWYHSGKRNRLYVGIGDGGLWDVVYSQIKNYKFVSGSWKLRSTYLKTIGWGTVRRNNLCNDPRSRNTYWVKGIAKSKYANDVRWSDPYYMQSAKRNHIVSRHYAHGQYRTFYLTW